MVAAYEPNGDRAPPGWARIIVLIAVVLGIFNVEAFDDFCKPRSSVRAMVEEQAHVTPMQVQPSEL